MGHSDSHQVTSLIFVSVHFGALLLVSAPRLIPLWNYMLAKHGCQDACARVDMPRPVSTSHMGGESKLKGSKTVSICFLIPDSCCSVVLLWLRKYCNRNCISHLELPRVSPQINHRIIQGILSPSFVFTLFIPKKPNRKMLAGMLGYRFEYLSGMGYGVTFHKKITKSNIIHHDQ